MNSFSTRRRTVLGAATALACAAVPAWGQSYPAKPITLVVPSLAGGGTDIIARAVGLELGKRLGQTVVVENAAGASGGIGAAKVAKAPADGHTLLVANSDLVLATLVHKSPGYALADLVPIANIGSSPLSLVARKGFEAANLDHLIKMAKAQPGKISVGLSGAATLPALGIAMLEEAAQIEFLKVPYKGASQVMTDLLGGQVDLAVTAVVNSVGSVRTGQVKMMGIMSQERLVIEPDFPRMPDNPLTRTVSLDIWLGLFGPVGLPEPVVQKLNEALQDILRDPSYKAQRTKTGEQIASPASAQEFARFVSAETARYRIAARRLVTQ